MPNNTTQSYTDVVQQNLRMREALVATSYRATKRLGVLTAAALGETIRIKLYNVGITTRLMLRVRGRVDVDAVAVAHAWAPHTFLSRINLTDYSNQDRVKCSGIDLFSVNSVRRRSPWGLNNEASAAVITNPTALPTALGDNQEFEYWIEVPLAYDEIDLRGMMLSQTSVGDAYLNCTVNPSAFTVGNVDNLYLSGTVTLPASGSVCTIEAWQDYIYPQDVRYIPPLDVATVYEIEGAQVSTDNLVAGGEKLISIPNVRSVIGTHLGYVFNNTVAAAQTAAANTTDITQWRMIANGTNILYDENDRKRIMEMRMWLNSDLLRGRYFYQYRARPIETALLGNVQIGLTPTNADANSRVHICHESFFVSGLALPGVPQSA